MVGMSESGASGRGLTVGREVTVGPGVRASDSERDEVADRLRLGATEGRLTLAELDERLGIVYAAQFRDELIAPMADLPGSAEPPPAVRRVQGGQLPLIVHAVLVTAAVIALITAWVLAGSAFAWPMVPMIWAVASLVVHVRLRHRWRRREG